MSQHPVPPTPSTLKRFKANPVEVALFSVVALICCNSLYNLFFDTRAFNPAALTPMAANPISEGRSPASLTQAFANIEVRCDTNADQTRASKVRLAGTFCSPTAKDASKLLKAQITNGANKFAATVFTDSNSNKYSTDYIPLNAGTNPIHLEFHYRDGKVTTQSLSIVKN